MNIKVYPHFIVIGLAILSQSAVDTHAGPVADHHQHLFSPAIHEKSGATRVSAVDLIQLLDEGGIEKAAVLSLAYQYGNPNRPPVENEYELVKAENDWASQQVAQFPSRLRGFCSVNPLAEYALIELRRCARDAFLSAGLKLHFGNSDVDLLNENHLEKLQALFREANTHGMSILIHMRSTYSLMRPYGPAQARSFLDSVLPEAPDVAVQIAHLAGAGGYDDPTVDEALDVFIDAISKKDPRTVRLHFDVSGVAGIGNWNGKRERIASRIRQLGVERILYGSDGTPELLRPRDAWAAFKELPLSNAEFEIIRTNVAPYFR